jgi:hypothetical protein
MKKTMKSKSKKESLDFKEKIKQLEGIEKAYLSMAKKHFEKNNGVLYVSFVREAAEIRKIINTLLSPNKND